jgi:hypothetical protein
VQTFLPYPDFAHSAQCLDRLRLGKQRVEAMQILNMVLGNSSYSVAQKSSNLRSSGFGWYNHPAYKMWINHERSLASYLEAMIHEWRDVRGYYNTIVVPHTTLCDQPSWLGDKRLHTSHRAALLAKNPEWYGRFGWTEEPKINYWWPTASAKIIVRKHK